MKSKISCFNKTIFLKNVTLYWPIWGLYLVYLLLMVPGALWLQLEGSGIKRWDVDEDTILWIIGNVINLSTGMIATFIMAIVTGMALYNYLFTAKSTNMIHALPVNRGELFGTNLISGLCFLIVPQVLAFIAGVMVCLSYHVTDVQYLGVWLLVMIGTAVVIYSMVVFCAMITGQLFTLPFLVVVLNFLYLLFYWLYSLMMELMGYGLTFYYGMDEIPYSWLSPMYYLFSHVYFFPEYTTKANAEVVCTGYTLDGEHVLIGYLVMAVVLLAAAYFIYRKRQLEQAGELLTNAAARLLFRWSCGFFFGYLIGILVVAIFEAVNIYGGPFLLLLMVLLFGWLFYVFAEMLVQKNFRIFKKRTMIESGIFLVLLMITFGGIKLRAYSKEQYIPDSDKIEKAILSSDINVVFEGDDIDEVLEYQKEILAHAKEYRTVSWNDWGYWNVTLQYIYKDGSIMERSYSIPLSEDSNPLLQYLCDIEYDPENFLTSKLGNDYPNMDRYLSGLMECWIHDVYESKEFGTKEAQLIAQAVIADAEAGVLQKYNLVNEYGGWEAYPTGYAENLSLEYITTETLEEYTLNDWVDPWMASAYPYWYGEVEYNNCYLNFGSDCTNIISALIEAGIIDSEDDLTLSVRDGQEEE